MAIEKPDFHIILESEGVDASSEYWQEQCWQLYNWSCRNLTEGSIEPLVSKVSEGERSDVISFFNVLVACGITGKIFMEVLDAVKIWLEYRPTAEITIECMDGSTIKITKLSISKLSKCIKEFPEMKICEIVNKFNNLKKESIHR